MAIKFAQAADGSDDSIRVQLIERLKVYLFGAIVFFASFGMGETVYRLLFSEFDGAKDRIPIEALFGFAFAWLATKFVGYAYRNRKERRARLNFIWARNHQIRGGPGRNRSVGSPGEKPAVDPSHPRRGGQD